MQLGSASNSLYNPSVCFADSSLYQREPLSVEIATSSSLAVLGRHIRLVCLDLMWRLLLSPKSGAFRGPHMELRNDDLYAVIKKISAVAMTICICEIES